MPNDPLFNTLMDREQQDPKPEQAVDPVLDEAFKLLKLEKPPAYKILEWKGKYPPKNSGTEVEAQVDSADPDKIIQVPNYSGIYKQALKGDPEAIQRLAGVIAHEMHHQQHGNDENSAYDAQIAALQQLGASKKTIDRVLQSREAYYKRFGNTVKK